MGKDPDAIRREIAQTRADMADTVDALAYKGDVKSRTRDKVRSLASKPKEAIVGVRDNVMGSVQQHGPDKSTIDGARGAVQQAPGQVADGARRVGGIVRENPVGLAIGGLALGYVTGLLVPSTRIEDEHLGTMGDTLRDQMKDTGQELLEHGKDVAQAAAGAARDAAGEAGAEHADELAASTKERGRQVRDTVGSGSTR